MFYGGGCVIEEGVLVGGCCGGLGVFFCELFT